MTATQTFTTRRGARRIGALIVGAALAALAGCGDGGSGGSATDSAAATMRPTRTPLFGGFTVTAGTRSATPSPTSGLPGTPTPTPAISGTPTVSGTPTRTGAPTPHGVLHVGHVQGYPGEYVSFDVTLDVTDGVEIAGTQNDISFNTNNVLRVENTDGNPFCVANPDIGKEHTSFAFSTESCGGDGTCVELRALVVSFENVDPIPSGARLYTCTVALSAAAPVGAVYPLVCSNAGASTPDGVAVPIDCENGAIVVGAGPTPIPTPRGTLHVGRVQGYPGEYVSFDVTLDVDDGVQIAGTQNDIGFDPNNVLRVENTDGDPFCVVNPDIGKEHTSFAFPPDTCDNNGICVALRALVLSFENVDPIPSGARLYTCTVALSAAAPVGAVPLVCSNAGASTPDGVAVPINCENGAIVVGAGPTPIPTPIPDPQAAGVCYESSTCDQFPVQRTRGDCCDFCVRSGLPCTWCPADMVDPSSGECMQCLYPCDGLP